MEKIICIIIVGSLYFFTCLLFYILAWNVSKTLDDDFTVKNLLITLFWPISIWFLK